MNRRTTQLLLAATALTASSLLAACGEDTTTAAAAAADNPATGRTVSVDDLLTDDDTVHSDGADWFTTSTTEGDGEAVFNTCAESGLVDTGALAVQTREFELRNTIDTDVEVSGDRLTQVVAQYDDEAAATKAWSTVNGWLEECAARPDALTDYRALQTRKVDVGVDGADAVITDSHYGPLPADLADGEAAYIMETGVVRVGDRLTVITSVIVGQDYNFLEEDGGTPVNQMLPRAAALLG